MFGFLKKKLSESVEKLSEKIKKKEEKAIEEAERPEVTKLPEFEKKAEPEVVKPEKERKPEKGVEKEGVKERKPGLKEKLAGKILERRISEKDIDSLFSEMELGLLEANVSLETLEFLKEKMKEYLVGKQLKRGEIDKEIR